MFEKIAHQNRYARVARQGLTLVEVVTSVAILSTMLVMLLAGYARHTRQIKQAARLQKAVELSDHLLADWFRDDSRLTDHQFGTFVRDQDYNWRLSVMPVSTSRLGGQVAELETFYVPDGNQTPVLTVELLVDRADQNPGVSR